MHPEKYGVKHTLKGIEMVSGSNAYIIDVVNAKGQSNIMTKRLPWGGKSFSATVKSVDVNKGIPDADFN